MPSGPPKALIGVAIGQIIGALPSSDAKLAGIRIRRLLADIRFLLRSDPEHMTDDDRNQLRGVGREILKAQMQVGQGNVREAQAHLSIALALAGGPSKIDLMDPSKSAKRAKKADGGSAH